MSLFEKSSVKASGDNEDLWMRLVSHRNTYWYCWNYCVKKNAQLRKPTLVLSIINLSVGSIEVLSGLVFLGAVIFGGVSV